MDPRYADAVQYIQDHLAQGFTEQQIRDHFLQSGWPAESIETALTYSKHNTAAPVTPEPETPTQPVIISSAPLSAEQPTVVSSSPEPAFAPTTNQPNLPVQTDEPQKYRVFKAIGDFFKAVAFNPFTFISTTIIGFIAAIILAVVPTFLFSHLLAASHSGSAFLVAILANLLLVFGTTSLAAAILMCLVSITTADAHAHRKRSVGQVLADTKSKLLKVFMVTWLSSAMMFGPLVIAYIALIISIFAALGGGWSGGSFYILLIIFPLLALLWLFIFGLRIALSQQVATFEPEISIISCLKRSSFLLKHGGQWFVFKAALLIILILFVLSLATGSGGNYEAANGAISGWASVVASVLVILLGVIFQGVLTLLYFNRAAVRGVRS